MLIALLLGACGGADDTALACDTMAAVSVSVTLESADGGPLNEAAVSYVPAETDGWIPCDVADGTWLCGYEVAGELSIQASAQGYATQVQTVDIQQGECHVVGQSLTMTLELED